MGGRDHPRHASTNNGYTSNALNHRDLLEMEEHRKTPFNQLPVDVLIMKISTKRIAIIHCVRPTVGRRAHLIKKSLYLEAPIARELFGRLPEGNQ
jgi:hypothetical protein